MIPDDVKDIMLNLLEKSNEGKINWVHASDAFPDESPYEKDFVLNTKNSSLNIFLTIDHTIRVNFLNDKGDIVLFFETAPDEEDYEILSEILDSAHYRYLNKDGVIEDLRKFIENINEGEDDGLIPF